MKPRYRIVTRGGIAAGRDPDEVREAVRRLCRYRLEVLERVFSGKPFVFKSGLDREEAARYLKALAACGLVCRALPLTPAGAAAEAPPQTAPKTARPAAPQTAVKTVPKARSAASASLSVAEPAPAPVAAAAPCPKCGTERAGGLTCDACGIVFEKYRRQEEQRRQAELLGVSTAELARQQAAAEAEPQEGYFARHREQAFILKAFGVIALIIGLQNYLSGLIGLFVLLFPVLFFTYIRLQATVTGENPTDLLRQHITFMPVMYAEGERKQEGVATVTYLLILINVLVFYGIELRADPDVLFANYLFLPYEPNAWNVPVSAFTAIFLHASGGHLWGNMVFLWTVGTVVERRVGHLRFLVLYLVTGLAAGIFGVIVFRLFLDETLHGLGASGAIAGVMGLFAVRCYFKSMVFPLPILGIFSLILPVSLKVRLNSLVIIGLFFLADLGGGIGQISGSNASPVGHWVHIGGMLAGIGLALFLKLGDQAVEERHMEIGASALGGGKTSLGAGEDSLRLALRQNPENAEAMLMLARIQSRYTVTDEGRDLYRGAIARLVGPRPQEAAAAFVEYFQKYMQGVEPELQLRLANVFQRGGDLDMAGKCLEMLANDRQTPAPVREQAMFQNARVLEALGFDEAARDTYALFVETFPASPHLGKARARLAVVGA